MNNILLCDFGSTWTKLTAVNLQNSSILGTATAYTTVETDLQNGFQQAMVNLGEKIGDVDFDDTKACSSAAGGLRMIVSGLVPELTVEAARLAALGAGAKIIKVYSHEMISSDMEEIASIQPDIFLLTGGTDGGNKECIIHNARMLAKLKPTFPILVAGNRTANDEIKIILKDATVYFCANVLPSVNQIKIEEVQSNIRDIFLEKIIEAKGISKISNLISNIMMPTPVAMMKAMQLLSEGTANSKGKGDLIAVDLGGATTDVYSFCEGNPKDMNTVIKGIKEPFAKRTVEGDIGMRYSLHGIVDEYGIPYIAEQLNQTEEKVEEMIQHFSENTDCLPSIQEETEFDLVMAQLAVKKAVERHAGTLEEVYTPIGKAYMQKGKDLRMVETAILTGGALIHAGNKDDFKEAIQFDMQQSQALKPIEVNIIRDEKYILSAMGILSEQYPEIALQIMQKELYHE